MTTVELDEALARRRAARAARPQHTAAPVLAWARGKVEQLKQEFQA